MRKENIKSMHPMNLQFFADPTGTEPNATGASSTEPASTEPSASPKPDEPDTTKPPTVEEQLQQLDKTYYVVLTFDKSYVQNNI